MSIDSILHLYTDVVVMLKTVKELVSQLVKQNKDKKSIY